MRWFDKKLYDAYRAYENEEDSTTLFMKEDDLSNEDKLDVFDFVLALTSEVEGLDMEVMRRENWISDN